MQEHDQIIKQPSPCPIHLMCWFSIPLNIIIAYLSNLQDEIQNIGIVSYNPCTQLFNPN
jgi:hypothetical protein